MYNIEKLKEIVKGPVSGEIKAMRAEFAAYVRHIFGTGTDAYLSQINEYENKKQHELRQKHAIKNPWIIDELLRPIDNIWQAKGGDETYSWTSEDQTEVFATMLKDVRGGMSLKDFMREIWLQRFASDPNGIIFLEVTPDGQKAQFTYKSIEKIHAYGVSGTSIDWIVFEPHETVMVGEKKDEKISYSWAVDEEFYYRVKNDGKSVEVEEILFNSFGMVPGVVCSSIFDTNKGYKVSILDKQVDLLNSYLTKNSIKEIYQFKHNYALFWMYQTICPTCNGTRKSGTEVCGTCGGSGYMGKKDVSDAFIVPKPEPDIPSATPPAGYIQPDVETCSENRNELDWLFDKMFHSLWGTTVQKSDNETATGRFIDTMPVYNKLNTIADIAQTIHRQLAEIYARFYFPLTFKGAKISYSRRYIIEGPDVLWKRYQDARAAKAPTMALNYMLEQFYYSEFASNPAMADYYIKLMYVEPYVHQTIEEVEDLGVGNDLVNAKKYFGEWLETKQIIDVEGSTIEKMNTELILYVTAKMEAIAAKTVGDIQKTALNGAQIESLLLIVTNVAGGTLPPDAAKIVIQQAFPSFDATGLDQLVQSLKIVKKVDVQPK